MKTAEDSLHFVEFLMAMGMNRAATPDVYSKDGANDCVLVSGDLDFDAPDEIRYIYNEKLSYLFA